MTYRDQFAETDAAARYDEVEYAATSYSGLLWAVEQEQLDDAIEAATQGRPFRYLDFACGTGRVLAHVAPHAAEATGIEISPAMAARARARTPGTTVVVADITARDAGVEGSYDVITTFRFLLNAEPALRRAGLVALRARLADERAVLVFNNHGNLASHKALLAGVHRVRRGGRRVQEGNLMTHRAVVALARECGLRVERVAGAGLLGGRLAERLPARVAGRLERAFARSPLARFGSNQLYVAHRDAA